MEYLPLALAIIVLLKVEIFHANGNADMERNRGKLAEYRHGRNNSFSNIALKQIHQPSERHRAAGEADNGDLRGPKSRKGAKTI